jgi:TolB-like protein/Tfp pilus assembly protein PilF
MVMQSASRELYAFEGYTLDPTRGCLRGSSGEIELRPKSFELLLYLIENAGRLIPKDELINAVWPNVIVSDDSLAQCVSDLRYALNDPDRRMIKTVPRRGYLFAAPVSILANETTTSLSRPALPLPDKPSVAVLPFENMTGDPDQDYFVDGVVEEITTAISRLPWLFVIARNSSFSFKGRAVDVKQLGRELGVLYILEGSVRKAGNRVRITGQLVNTVTSAHIWADRCDASLDDIFELQDQVASSVLGAIEPRLRLSEIERATSKPTENLHAYDLYLRALAQFHKYSQQGMCEAIPLLKRALAIDPSYAPAAAMVGLCRGLQRGLGWESVSDSEIEEALRLARQALEEGKNDPDALWMAGDGISILAREHDTAAGAIDRALKLNPNSAHAWMAKGWVACCQNQPLLAIEALERAIRLSPLDPHGYFFSGGLALAHLVAAQYQEAIEWADRCWHEYPRHITALPLRIRIVSCAHLGRIEEARNGVKRLLELNPRSTIARWTANTETYYSQETLTVFVEGYRKAGLPEN